MTGFPEFPRIVIEIEDGLVASIYFAGIQLLCAVIDNDQRKVGEEAVSFMPTLFIEDVSDEMRQEINRLLDDERD